MDRAGTGDPLLSVAGLTVSYRDGARVVPAVRDVSFEIATGEVYGLIGESGSGKTTVAYSVLRHVPGATVAGRITFDGQDLLTLPPRRLRSYRGGRIAVVHQDPQAALNPSIRVGAQVAEAMLIHGRGDKDQAHRRTLELFADVGLPDPARIARRYPYELSGGQQQRVVIAMALSCEPELLIMDEPTTGLDVTTEARIMDLVRRLRTVNGLTILFISHDLALVAGIADRVGVMAEGTLVEQGPMTSVLAEPRHPYSRRLISAVATDPSGPPARRSTVDRPALRVLALSKSYPTRGARRERGVVRAVDQVSFEVAAGQTLAVVGESGSGKTTLAHCLAGLTAPDSGALELAGATLAGDARARTAGQRKAVQMVFQNPDASLNPRHRVEQILTRPMALYGLGDREERRDRAAEMLRRMRLPVDYLNRLPGQLSGGQKQRVAIARAFVADPDVILCDEPTSALDVSVQAALLELLADLQSERGVAYVFITHDLSVVRRIAHHVVVMRDGTVVESGPADHTLAEPQHAYTRDLLAAAPTLAQALSAH